MVSKFKFSSCIANTKVVKNVGFETERGAGKNLLECSVGYLFYKVKSKFMVKARQSLTNIPYQAKLCRVEFLSGKTNTGIQSFEVTFQAVFSSS